MLDSKSLIEQAQNDMNFLRYQKKYLKIFLKEATNKSDIYVKKTSSRKKKIKNYL